MRKRRFTEEQIIAILEDWIRPADPIWRQPLHARRSWEEVIDARVRFAQERVP